MSLQKKLQKVYSQVREITDNSITKKPEFQRKKELLIIKQKRELAEKKRLKQIKLEEEDAKEREYYKNLNNALQQAQQEKEKNNNETKLSKNFFTTDIFKK